ncbi:unnamed protein product [marine sediment metagenome]|uniref:Uncharacterized protein n=1 Tax=marine sediment metagenome TaxID=412755 RepID=X0VAF6_9ZZZZ
MFCDKCDAKIKDTRAGEITISISSCVDKVTAKVNICGECRAALLGFLRGCQQPDLRWAEKEVGREKQAPSS